MARSRVQEEIGQTRPFRSQFQEGVVALVRTADVIRRHYARVLEAEGMTTQQFNVLRILRGAGKEGLPTMEIGRRMIEQTPGVTRLVDRLIGKKWVARDVSPEDRRQVVCRITPEGIAVLSRMDGPIAAADDRVLSVLSEKRLRSFIAILDDIRAGLEPS